MEPGSVSRHADAAAWRDVIAGQLCIEGEVTVGSCCLCGLRSLRPVGPGGCLVVGGAGLGASVEDPRQPSRHAAPGVLVPVLAGAGLVVVRAGPVPPGAGSPRPAVLGVGAG